MPAGTGIAPPRCHPPPDGGTLGHVNNSLPGPLSEGSVHGNGSRQPDNWLSALAEPFVTVLAHGNRVYREPSRSEPTSSHDSRGARCRADADVPTTRDSLPLRCRQRCQSGSGKNDSNKDWERNALSEWMTRVTSV